MQLSLLSWAIDRAVMFRECYCWYSLNQGEACSTCRWQMLTDFNYVSAFVEMFGEKNENTID